MIRCSEIDGKKATNEGAYKRIAFAAKETKALNELVKAGFAYAKVVKE